MLVKYKLCKYYQEQNFLTFLNQSSVLISLPFVQEPIAGLYIW